MRENEVPQDRGVTGDNYRIEYAINDEGNYKLVKSLGSDLVNIANEQVWRTVQIKSEQEKKRVLEKKVSPIAYYIALNQMDLKILSKLTNMSRIRIFWHLRPRVFDKLHQKTLQIYAKVFNISVEELTAPLSPTKGS